MARIDILLRGELNQSWKASDYKSLSRLVEVTIVLKENSRSILSQLQWNQSINVYGIDSSRCDYINTCEVYELEILLSCLPAHWWKSFAIELINKSGWYQYLEVKPEQVRGTRAALSID